MLNFNKFYVSKFYEEKCKYIMKQILPGRSLLISHLIRIDNWSARTFIARHAQEFELKVCMSAMY